MKTKDGVNLSASQQSTDSASSEKDLKLVFHPETLKQYKNLEDFVRAKKPSLNAVQIREAVEKLIKDQLIQIAKIQYLLMEKTDDFTEAGEQRVAISFCRLLLNIPPSREVTQIDANRFREEMSQCDELLKKPSATRLREMLKDARFTVGEIFIPIGDDARINQILNFVGSDHKYFFAMQGNYYAMLYGPYTILEDKDKAFGNEEVLVIDRESARMPYSILSMAASSYPRGKMIRRESCETIFYNKWFSFYETSDFEKDLLLSHDYSNIRESIKLKAFAAYQVTNQSQLSKIKDLFIDEMIEGIVYHEFGHSISLEEDRYLPEKMAAIASSLSAYGTEAVSVLKEALADWAPRSEKAQGPIWHFIQVSKKDYLKAKRMVYVYLSDYWFLDFGEEFMGETTDIIIPLITQFIDEKGEIDFVRMEKLHQKVFEFLVKLFQEAAKAVLNIYEKASYQVTTNQILTFDVLEKEMFKALYNKDQTQKKQTLEESQAYSFYWVNVNNYLKKFSPDSYLKLKDWLKKYTQTVNAELLKRLSNQKSELFQNSLRQFVISEMKRISCYQQEKKITPEEILNNIYDELNFNDAVRQKVNVQIEEISSAKKKIDVAINYEAKPSPLIAVIQKLMILSDFGEIKSGMSLGENISEELSPDQKIAELTKVIAGIKKQISEKMYENISLIKFNTDYLSQEIYEKEFSAIAAKGSFDLNPLVKEKKYLPFFEDHMLEVFISSKKGIWDWNTVQAVWRINQMIRPKAEDKQWVIDDVFWNQLLEEAVNS